MTNDRKDLVTVCIEVKELTTYSRIVQMPREQFDELDQRMREARGDEGERLHAEIAHTFDVVRVDNWMDSDHTEVTCFELENQG